MGHITRRTFVTGLAGATGLTLWTADHARAIDRSLARAAARAVNTTGTTLEQAAAPGARLSATGAYRRLTAGPGYPLVVRPQLAAPKTGRDDRRRALASFVQITDVHIIDAQSPMRVEFLHSFNGSAFRPHEALGSHGGISLVNRINSLKGGPYTGRPFDCVVSTGDNTDNDEEIELSWFLTLLAGGKITPNTGGPQWEGVQNFGSTLFYNVESPLQDQYKKKGFPQIPGFLSRAMAPVTSPGLRTRWYSVFGNHDNSVQGTMPLSWDTLAETYTGTNKILGIRDPSARAGLERSYRSGRPVPPNAIPKEERIVQQVTPDPRRRPLLPGEYIAAHLKAAVTGAGPVGHGFTAESASTGRAYYSFRIAPGVTGISLDSTNPAGWTEGSLGERQFFWLERLLMSGSSRYHGKDGRPVTHRVADELFFVFSHHTSDTMTNLIPNLSDLERRYAGMEVLELLHRFPNVLAWVNGHTHNNVITPRPHTDPRRAFWEVNTASHVDFPQHARLLELVDNADGTLSLFTTLVESDAPYAGGYGSGAQRDLAALYREMSFNDLHVKKRNGSNADRNTELLLVNPLGKKV
ncbi:TIGR03767 family metallophosphoesterase [Austwickia chelonae]|uniref:TIGR03767 family metallophosphoesterase n=1 Tax=Austwickia chelonae TaxID=100225 RepID=UPI000E2232E2|nr:TIGR03767 family metallophosphoesterase [Austwickia chelonae]